MGWWRTTPDYEKISRLLCLSRRRGVPLDQDRIEQAARMGLAALSKGLEDLHLWREALEKIPGMLDVIDHADANVDLYGLQRGLLALMGKGEMSQEIQAIASRIGISLDGSSGLTHSPDLES